MKIFDAHFHIIDYHFPVVANNNYLPPEFTIEDYGLAVEDLEVIGGAIVSGSFQAFDQTYLKDAISKLGDQFVGVANIPFNISDLELDDLQRNNIRAVRFNLKRGGSEGVEHMEYLSSKLMEQYGWHTELYVDSKDLVALRPVLQKLKSFSIDHFGLSKEGLKELLHWVEKGVKIKATGFGRIDFEPMEVMRMIYNINPEALLFGTDLPSTRAKRPFALADVELIKENFDESEQERIFYKNAKKWYLHSNLCENELDI